MAASFSSFIMPNDDYAVKQKMRGDCVINAGTNLRCGDAGAMPIAMIRGNHVADCHNQKVLSTNRRAPRPDSGLVVKSQDLTPLLRKIREGLTLFYVSVVVGAV